MINFGGTEKDSPKKPEGILDEYLKPSFKVIVKENELDMLGYDEENIYFYSPNQVAKFFSDSFGLEIVDYKLNLSPDNKKNKNLDETIFTSVLVDRERAYSIDISFKLPVPVSINIKDKNNVITKKIMIPGWRFRRKISVVKSDLKEEEMDMLPFIQNSHENGYNLKLSVQEILKRIEEYEQRMWWKEKFENRETNDYID